MLQATVVTAGTRDGFGSAAADLTELLAVPGDAVGQVDDVEDLGTAEAGDLHSTRGPEAMASPAAKSWVPPGEPEPRLPASRDAVRNGSAPIPFSGPTAAGPRGEAASETGSTGTLASLAECSVIGRRDGAVARTLARARSRWWRRTRGPLVRELGGQR